MRERLAKGASVRELGRLGCVGGNGTDGEWLAAKGDGAKGGEPGCVGRQTGQRHQLEDTLLRRLDGSRLCSPPPWRLPVLSRPASLRSLLRACSLSPSTLLSLLNSTTHIYTPSLLYSAKALPTTSFKLSGNPPTISLATIP